MPSSNRQRGDARSNDANPGIEQDDIQAAIDKLYSNNDNNDDYGYYEEPVTVDFLDTAYDYDYDYEQDIPYSVHAKPPEEETKQFPLIRNRQSFFAKEGGDDDANTIFHKLASIVGEEREGGCDKCLEGEFQQGVLEQPRFIFQKEEEEEEGGRLNYESGPEEKKARVVKERGQKRLKKEEEEDTVERPLEEREEESPTTFYPIVTRTRGGKESGGRDYYFPWSGGRKRSMKECLNAYFDCLQGGLGDGVCRDGFERCSDNAYIVTKDDATV